ncbi:flavodoxin reductase [Ahniella affigens]|uniref:Flavodoxin reductase n=1 Tax=Ahniella affigens TaxID=2021234 RepID=A0A2P1PVL1_9GAMM|nr:fatty acid desaturase [Ahniella affigens]AVP98886.1 flavodoxin reductase [Ahniella affigens]
MSDRADKIATTHFTAALNEHLVTVGKHQTVLDAALAAGVPMRYRCRVGGCGSCKCRLQSGQVFQRTDTSYLLSATERAEGVVLACQTVPRSDVTIAFDPEPETLPWHAGRVTGQRLLTPDVVEWTVTLATPWSGTAGQHAAMACAGLPGVVRELSPIPSGDGRVLRFLIRLIPGGQLSTWLQAADRTGEAVQLSAGRGELLLPMDASPVLMIATGTGIAPMLAMLEAAARSGDRRDMTVLFGVRREEDLQLAAPWLDAAPEYVRFVPVLSQASAAWTGLRGHVQDHLDTWHAAHQAAGHQVIRVCGVPVMVHSVLATLHAMGVPQTSVAFDQFDEGPSLLPEPPQQDLPPDQRVPARWFDYAKYLGFHAIGVFSLLSLLAGGAYTTIGLLVVVAVYILGDALAGDDVRTPDFRAPKWLTWQLWAALPLLAMIAFAAVWSVAPTDAMGFGQWLSALSGYDLLAARADSTVGHHVAGLILTGLMIGLIGTIPAHELVHRTWDRASLLIGRWLLAFSVDSSFSIEHVYGHHRYVATRVDPATAPRGRNVYWHMLRSTWLGNRSAWAIETARLAKLGRSTFSPFNAVLRGFSMSLVLILAAWAVGGVVGMLFFVGCALFGKALLEVVNYMEHYGLVRAEHAPVAPRHSWNTNRRVSSWTMFNLTRHSHHHAEGEVSYPDLRPYPNAPMMVSGYLTTLIIALIPPLWHALLVPKLRDWDRRYANAEERVLADAANERSGLAGLRDDHRYSNWSANTP